MGNTDSVPVVSQLKSLVQFAAGDSAGALATQQNFAYNNTFPVISQIASAGYAIGGDHERALDLQKKFAKDMERVIDSIPVAGHIKGSVHYALGQNDEGDAAMKSASRSTGAVIGGVGGFAAGGPAGAVAGGKTGGIAGGAAVDGIITGSEILTHGPTARPYGYVQAGLDIKDVVDGKRNITVEQGFDMAMVPVSDGIGGYAAGVAIGKPLGLNTGGKAIPLPSIRGGYRGGGSITAAGNGGGAAKLITVLDDATLAKQAGAANAGNIVKTAGVMDDMAGVKPPTINGGRSVAAAGDALDNAIPNPNRIGLDKAALDNRANQLNPNHAPSGPGRPAGYQGTATKADLNNHANQMNPNHPAYQASRVLQSGDKAPVISNDGLLLT